MFLNHSLTNPNLSIILVLAKRNDEALKIILEIGYP